MILTIEVAAGRLVIFVLFRLIRVIDEDFREDNMGVLSHPVTLLLFFLAVLALIWRSPRGGGVKWGFFNHRRKWIFLRRLNKEEEARDIARVVGNYYVLGQIAKSKTETETGFILEQLKRCLDVIDKKTVFTLSIAAALIAVQGFILRDILPNPERYGEIYVPLLFVAIIGLLILLLAAVMALWPGARWVAEINELESSDFYPVYTELVKERREREDIYFAAKTLVIIAVCFVAATYGSALGSSVDHQASSDAFVSPTSVDPVFPSPIVFDSVATVAELHRIALGPFNSGEDCSIRGPGLRDELNRFKWGISGKSIQRIEIIGSADVQVLGDSLRPVHGSNVGLAEARARCVAGWLMLLGIMPVRGDNILFRLENAKDHSNAAAQNGQQGDRWVDVYVFVRSDKPYMSL